ncbi:hypothetical protein AMTRI_Chr12g234360 [Amborella trichopoda]|uniref:Flavin-containing monooxygenase n=1 Tax=Amborella trichopoda TaxID=13333 RepID=W1PD10_AMBTC|nr:probable flavin-containing monooxygenase 1 [Amborella trichopoda]ERN05516.1 hypothetical protein AMTR_s00007p00261040 [Amborella trichopoda]|eukprot:XP_006843841.1 probable flavin-containing monooxygenase 1 [Amborella trichopoda]
MENHDFSPKSGFIETKVAIVGAGISGIAAAKQLRNLKPVVFEVSDSTGGVWKHCTFHSTKLQTPRLDFQFSDYPWPKSVTSLFPSHSEFLDYLDGYARHFDVLKFIKFNSKVVHIRFSGDCKSTEFISNQWGEKGRPIFSRPIWELAVKTNDSDDLQWYRAEFVVMCTGKYGNIPRIPVFPHGKGPEKFNGKVMHTLDYSKLDKESAHQLLKGKKVVVVGYKKSAIDLATECAEANQGPDGKPCTVVIRTLHWIVPPTDYIWGVPFHLLYGARSAQFLHEKPSQTFFREVLCRLFAPVRKAVSKFVEAYLIWNLPIKKYGLVPDHPFEEDYASCQMALVPENFFPAADDGRIIFRRAEKWWFWSEGIELDDRSKVEADIVMLATGFEGSKKLKSLFPQPLTGMLEHPSGVMPLYRGTIHPLIPNMAFVGYIQGVSGVHAAELRCKWLAHLIEGGFVLPSVEEMMEHTNKEIKVMTKSTRFYKRQCTSTFDISQYDEICEDMGWKAWRKKNWVSEAFSAYTNLDYGDEN